MPVFKVPVTWQMTGEMLIDAPTLAEALKKATTTSASDIGGDYLGDSLRFNWVFLEEDLGMEMLQDAIKEAKLPRYMFEV